MLPELCTRKRQIWQADPDLSARSKGISAAKLVLFFLDSILNTVLLMLPYSGCGEMALSRSRSAATYARTTHTLPLGQRVLIYRFMSFTERNS